MSCCPPRRLGCNTTDRYLSPRCCTRSRPPPRRRRCSCAAAIAASRLGGSASLPGACAACCTAARTWASISKKMTCRSRDGAAASPGRRRTASCGRSKRRRPSGRIDPLVGTKRPTTRGVRSEEHTSELQSLAYLVCRLLLEKKKKKQRKEKLDLRT